MEQTSSSQLRWRPAAPHVERSAPHGSLAHVSQGLLLAICVAGGGCAAHSDGTVSPGLRGSQLWHEKAPVAEVVAYYDKMTLEELCETWWLSHRSGSSPSAAGDKARLDAFARRGKNLSDCSSRYRF